jgi:uncharacterized protein YjbJ (UPF0337 family)
MGIHNEGKIKGKPEQGSGHVNEKPGKWTDDPVHRSEGRDQYEEGATRESYGKVPRRGRRKMKEQPERVSR